MRMPNLLASKHGRFAAFFFLYITEGIPLGFTAVAIATQMRRQGLGPDAIGAFVGSLYLPWAFKWALGPIVDTITSERFGRRRTWIVGAQILMAGTLLAALPIDFATRLQVFTAIILVHNCFGAAQDVAIDALAVNSLKQEERGLANGLMFGGAYLGQAIGGAGVLFLTPYVGFSNTYYFVAAAIGLVTLFISLPLREAKSPPRESSGKGVLPTIAGEIWAFIRNVVKAFFGSRAALVGVVFALLPAGAYALGLNLQSNIAVELGLNDHQVGVLSLWTAVISAIGCVAGGWLSDRFGRRRMLALFIVLMTIPTAIFAFQMQQAGWIMPVSPTDPGRPIPPTWLVSQFWILVIVYAAFQGLSYGIRSALFMDVTTPAVAATQFTAYMAMLNYAIAYSATWQGAAATKWGYPITLGLDAAFGLLCLVCLPFMARRREKAEAPPPGAAVEPATG
jgi:PAT family beta-lactamase induction signal transducer AmpG